MGKQTGSQTCSAQALFGNAFANRDLRTRLRARLFLWPRLRARLFLRPRLWARLQVPERAHENEPANEPAET